MNVLKKIWNAFTTLLMIAVLILAIALVGVRLVGVRPFTVLSGSMEPTYHTGSVIYVKSVDYRELRVGDPITFMLNEDTVATHRIVEIVPDDEDPTVLRYRTKGDANENEDGGLVHYKNVLGKPIFTVPKIGYIVDYIQHPPGTYVSITVGALAVLLVFLPELIRALFTDEEEEKKTSPKPEKKEKPRGKRGTERSAESDFAETMRNATTPEEPEERPVTQTAKRPPARPEPRKTSRVLPRKKKGRHEL